MKLALWHCFGFGLVVGSALKFGLLSGSYVPPEKTEMSEASKDTVNTTVDTENVSSHLEVSERVRLFPDDSLERKNDHRLVTIPTSLISYANGLDISQGSDQKLPKGLMELLNLTPAESTQMLAIQNEVMRDWISIAHRSRNKDLNSDYYLFPCSEAESIRTKFILGVYKVIGMERANVYLTLCSRKLDFFLGGHELKWKKSTDGDIKIIGKALSNIISVTISSSEIESDRTPWRMLLSRP